MQTPDRLNPTQDDSRNSLPSDGPQFEILSGSFGGKFVPGQGAYTIPTFCGDEDAD
jgi:hypothetical protein